MDVRAKQARVQRRIQRSVGQSGLSVDAAPQVRKTEREPERRGYPQQGNDEQEGVDSITPQAVDVGAADQRDGRDAKRRQYRCAARFEIRPVQHKPHEGREGQDDESGGDEGVCGMHGSVGPRRSPKRERVAAASSTNRAAGTVRSCFRELR